MPLWRRSTLIPAVFESIPCNSNLSTLSINLQSSLPFTCIWVVLEGAGVFGSVVVVRFCAFGCWMLATEILCSIACSRALAIRTTPSKSCTLLYRCLIAPFTVIVHQMSHLLRPPGSPPLRSTHSTSNCSRVLYIAIGSPTVCWVQCNCCNSVAWLSTVL